MKKRIICMLLALMMLVSSVGVLSACKKKDNNGDNTTCTHVDEDANGKCDKCNAAMSASGGGNGDGNGDGGGETIEYPWDSAKLIFKMTHNTNMDELSSTCGQYLAGGKDVGKDFVYETCLFDDDIKDRNSDAYRITKVEVTYDYYANSDSYQWGKVVGDIGTVLSSGSTKNIPDMYCNFVYDLVAASLSGYFANLMGSSTGTNYFEFNKEGYVPAGKEGPDPDKDLGYMYEYMRSTTLSDEKMYILASDYFTDMIRAFFVVPVNVGLLNDITVDGLANNLQDFYKEVNERKWTYDRLAEYAEAVHNQAGVKPSLKNDILGFALPCEGLPASGILYSTNITIVNRVWDSELAGGKGDYTYSYPAASDESANQLYEMVDKLSELMGKPGVLAINSDVDWTEVEASKSLLAVRTRFCEDGILFGGIECIGALEGNKYQTLNTIEGRGFGVVPVPMYEEPAEGSTKTYTTSIHNVGRPGAITFRSAKFAECTAFLNYQSTHSSEILELYYEYNIEGKLASGEASNGTAAMLGFIRDNVRSAFDKTMEDAIDFKNNSDNADQTRWHAILSSGAYNMDIRTSYKELIDWKQKKLSELQNDYAACP